MAPATTHSFQSGSPVHIPKISLFHLPTGDPHPVLENSDIEFELDPPMLGVPFILKVQLCGDHLAVLYAPRNISRRIFVFVWKTGELLSVFNLNSNSDFAFLSERIIIVANAERGSLDFWCVPTTSQPTSQPFHSLLVPMSGPKDSWQITLSVNPPPRTRKRDPGVPFHNSPLNALVLLKILSWPSKLSAVIPMRTLLSLLPPIDTPSPLAAPAPWRTWGPTRVRWFNFRWFIDGQLGRQLDWRAVCGMRFVLRPQHAAAARLLVLDFSPRKVRPLLRTTTPPPGVCVIAEDDGGFEATELFLEPFGPMLPYVRYESQEEYALGDIMIGERCIVIRTNGGKDARVKVFHFG
jgi:hypothetical protein